MILSGPSGCGKTTVGEVIVKRPGIRRVVTATSRKPRRGEKNGRDYIFYSPTEFRRRVRNGEFLENVMTLGHYYGTPRRSVEMHTEKGVWALCLIDVKGAAKIRGSGVKAVTIFLVPPSPGELEKRLRSRGTESEAAIKRRLALAKREMKEKLKYNHAVVNDAVPNAAERILSFLRRRGWKG